MYEAFDIIVPARLCDSARRRRSMLKFRIALVAVLAFGAFSAQPSVARAADSTQAETRSAPERVTADTARATPGGATFAVPSGWTIETGKDFVVLTPPEIDTHVAIGDSHAADAKAAVEAAWAAYKPESKRPLKLVTPRPGRDGWDERPVFDYETSPNERAVVRALALRAGSSWTVALLDGTEPTFEKRAAAIGISVQSLRPKGYARESCAGRKAEPLDAAHIAQMKSF